MLSSTLSISFAKMKKLLFIVGAMIISIHTVTQFDKLTFQNHFYNANNTRLRGTRQRQAVNEIDSRSISLHPTSTIDEAIHTKKNGTIRVDGVSIPHIPFNKYNDSELPQITKSRLLQTTGLQQDIKSGLQRTTRLPDASKSTFPKTTKLRLPQNTRLPQTVKPKLPRLIEPKLPQITKAQLPQTIKPRLPLPFKPRLPQPTNSRLQQTIKSGLSQPDQPKVSSQLARTANITTWSRNRFSHNISWLISPEVNCKEENITLLIVIATRLTSLEERQVIRETWGSPKHLKTLQSRLLFIVGTPTQKNLKGLIRKESDIFGDIIQADFLDTYHNLTLKSKATLKWAKTFCSSAKFLLKTDDDMFIHVPNLLKTLTRAKQDKFITCCVLPNSAPIRDQESKYVVTWDEYSGNMYPPFCSGTAYAMPQAAITPLYTEAERDNRFFPLEDVYITGLMAARANITRIHNLGFRQYGHIYDPCGMQSVISMHEMGPSQMRRLWASLPCKRRPHNPYGHRTVLGKKYVPFKNKPRKPLPRPVQNV